MIQFAQPKEDQNRLESGKDKGNRKGPRELHGLNCSINFDRTKEQEREPGGGVGGLIQRGRKEIPGGIPPYSSK